MCKYIIIIALQFISNLFQTDCDDYKEECSKTKQSQQEEINTLQSKLSELQEELKTVKASKESLKVIIFINHFLQRFSYLFVFFKV